MTTSAPSVDTAGSAETSAAWPSTGAGWWLGSQQFCRQQIVQPGIGYPTLPAPPLPLP